MKPLLKLSAASLATFTLLGGHVERTQPEPSLVIPCELVEWYDGDTGTVRVSLDARVRLLDCWAPEVHTLNLDEKKRGIDSRDHLRTKFPAGSSGLLEIPLRGERLDDVITLGRVLGRVWIDGKDVSAEQVSAGHATPTKGGE